MKLFKELIKDYKVSKEKQLTKECLNTEIDGIAYNSKLIKENYLFVAIKGLKDDGHKYIESAIQNKASIIIYDNTADKDFIKGLQDKYENVYFAAVKNPRECLAYVSAKFYDEPTKKINTIGITGTNGKTTTTYLLKSVLEANKNKTTLIGTIKNMIGEKDMNEFNQNSNLNPQPMNFNNYETDSFDLNTLNDPNLTIPTNPLPNQVSKPTTNTTFDFSSSFIPNTNTQATTPNFDSLLKVEEPPVVEPPKTPTVQIEKSPAPNQYFPSLEEKPANMNFGQAFSNPIQNNSINIMTAIDNTKQLIRNLESEGYKVETNELDLPDSYQITIKIKKN